MTAGQLRALRFSGDLTRDVVWFARAVDWMGDPSARSADPPALRRAAAMVPADRDLAELLEFVGAVRTVRGMPTDDLEQYRARLDELRAAEPDIADPTPLLTGEAVCAVLGIEPGRDVGVAMRWLRDLRLEEGPVAAERAATRLVEWWPTREIRE